MYTSPFSYSATWALLKQKALKLLVHAGGREMVLIYSAKKLKLVNFMISCNQKQLKTSRQYQHSFWGIVSLLVEISGDTLVTTKGILFGNH